MSSFFKLGVLFALSTMLAVVADTPRASAQRIQFRSQDRDSNNNQNNNDRDADEEHEHEDEGEVQQLDRSSKSSKSNRDQRIQQFIDGRQGGQNSSRPGNQGGNQNIQIQDGQIRFGGQQFRPQENQQNLRFGNWQGEQWQGSRNVNNWAQAIGGGKRPFSSDWYRDHPKAWKYDHNHDDMFVVATLPGVYSWLNWGAVPAQPGVRIGPAPDLSRYHDFYPLGVYSLMSGYGDMGTRVVQLAIDHHGHIAGNYYDMITDTNSSISGDVRRQDQRVVFWLNKNQGVRFRARLSRLVQPYGTLTVQMPGGEQDWQFVRLEQ